MAEGTFVRYNAGFVFLSYLVSLIGCVTTLELLHRRTSRRGIYNWYLLISSCITMGGVGIWCMHFIGNRAISLGSGESGEQIVYNPGFTAASFFLPIIVLLAAFYILGITDKVNRWFIVISGILSGMAICGMHYVGQLGIANYVCTYRVANVVGAAAIAVVASLIALSVFFRLRELWTDSWWKRALCGALLAVAVSGMHWTAAVGTFYEFKGKNSMRQWHSRIQTIIVCTVLSISTCALLLGYSLFRAQKKRVQKTRAQQLVLATTYFDEEGRVMVTPDGGLPNVKITNHYVEKTFGEDELSRTHPTFVWVYKASRNWAAIKDLIPGMQEALENDALARRYRSGHSTPRDDESKVSFDFAVVFKKLFCVAASNLAHLVHEPLEKLGVLFEEPMMTGTFSAKRHSTVSRIKRLSFSSTREDVEKALDRSHYLVGRGQYLSVTKRLSKDDVEKFMALGYRFATISQVAGPLARSMQIPKDWMVNRLERMQNCSKQKLLPPGTHLACFAIRPSMLKSFDVLVPVKNQSQIPVARLQHEPLTTEQRSFLERFDEMTIEKILKILENESGTLSLAEEQEFRWHFCQAIEQLMGLVGNETMLMKATLSADIVQAPCRPRLAGDEVGRCTLICVRLIMDIHALAPKEGLTFVPMSFFGMQQVVDAGNSWEDGFRRQVRSEFEACIGGAKRGKGKTSLRGKKSLSRSGSVEETKMPDVSLMPMTAKQHLGVPDTTSTLNSPASPVRMSFGTSRESERSIESKTPIMSVEDREENGMGTKAARLMGEVASRESLTTLRQGFGIDGDSGSLRDGTTGGSYVNEVFRLFRL